MLNYPYHLVKVSPYPFLASVNLGSILICVIITLNSTIAFEIMLNNTISIYWSNILLFNIVLLGIVITLWIKEVYNENMYLGDHTIVVRHGLMLGYYLFLISEVMIFFSLFLTFFYNSFIPSTEFGYNYPPKGILVIDYLSVPLLNTVLLLLSSITITAAISAIKYNKLTYIYYLILTIIFNVVFSYLQYLEYFYSFFTINDSIYSSVFYIITSLHGIHVIAGTVLVLICLLKTFINTTTSSNNPLLIMTSIYLHFVDLVWIIVLLVLYIWGS